VFHDERALTIGDELAEQPRDTLTLTSSQTALQDSKRILPQIQYLLLPVAIRGYSP
jgi:hypothetical protein